MAGHQTITGQDKLENARVGIVASRFNHEIVERLLAACKTTLIKAGLREEDIAVVHVPGAFEIPVTIQRLILKTECDAVIALGAIIRGETPHFEYIARECSHGLAQVALNQDTPVIFGVLTVDNIEQANARSGEGDANKGAEAAQAAIQMINTLRKIK
jgi:6,7-dimethyl-8-ribityllumazine synthase